MVTNLFNFDEIQQIKESIKSGNFIQTSYHARAKDGYISISSSIPRWQSKKLKNFQRLSPFNIIKGAHPFEINNEEYILRFKEGLSRLNAIEIYSELKYLANGEIPTIICYEKPTDMCHRHLVVQWLKDEIENLNFKEVNCDLTFDKEKFCYL